MSVDARTVAERCGIDGFGLPLDGVVLVPMHPILERVLGKTVHAITLGRTVVISRSLFGGVVAGHESELLAHELTHVAQWQDRGIVAFPLVYCRGYLRLRLLGATHDAAYRSVGFEYEAFTRAGAIQESLL